MTTTTFEGFSLTYNDQGNPIFGEAVSLKIAYSTGTTVVYSVLPDGFENEFGIKEVEFNFLGGDAFTNIGNEIGDETYIIDATLDDGNQIIALQIYNQANDQDYIFILESALPFVIPEDQSQFEIFFNSISTTSLPSGPFAPGQEFSLADFTSSTSSEEDIFIGTDGDDFISAGDGRDTLSGGPGSDILEGGPGADDFIVKPGDETVTILDFTLGVDVLDLSEFDRKDALNAFYNAEQGSAILKFSDGTLLTVDGPGVDPNTLSLTNVKFAEGNLLPEGDVIVVGPRVNGQILLADVSSISDGDGLGELSYQWLSNGVEISGATLKNYSLVEADVGKNLSVKVSYIDKFGSRENIESLPTKEILEKNDQPTGVVVVGGAPIEGQILTATNSISDLNGLGAFKFQWQANGIDIPGATTSKLLLTQAEVEKYITVTINYIDEYGSFESVISGSTPAILNTNNAPVGTISITGDPIVGRTLSIDLSEVSDDDGVNFDNLEFQWLRNSNPILGANQNQYTLSRDDVDEFISVKITYIDNFGATESVISSTISSIVEVGAEVIGTPLNDVLLGGLGDDTILGEANDDTITGDAGDDIINGGIGEDTAAYSGSQSSYTFEIGADNLIVRDRREGGDGEDTLISIELVSFSGEAASEFNLKKVLALPNLNTAEIESLVELYIAYFNRAPDAVGLNFWGTAYANGTTLEEMARLFVDQDETRATYPDGTSNLDFATSVYSNVLGRTADQLGLEFWVDLLDEGKVTRDQFILDVLRGAKAELKPELGQDFVDQQLADKSYLDAKIDVGAYFAVQKGMSDVANAQAVMDLFDGSEASIDAAVAATDEFYLAALDPAEGEFLMKVVGVLEDPFIA